MHEGQWIGCRVGLTPAQRIAFYVAERLGMTVGEVCERMTTAEILTWARLPKIDEEHERERNVRKFWERIHGGSR